MNLRDRLPLVGDDEESEVREYHLIRQRGQEGDPSKIRTYDREKSPREVELEESLPVGRYALQKMTVDGNFGDQVWSEYLFGDKADVEEAIRRAERAEETARQVQEQAAQRPQTPRPSNPQEAEQYFKLELKKSIIENEQLMAQYGPKVVEYAFSDSGPDPEVDVELDSMADVALWKSVQDPGQFEDVASAFVDLSREVSRAAGEGLREGLNDGDPPLEDNRADRDPPAEGPATGLDVDVPPPAPETAGDRVDDDGGAGSGSTTPMDDLRDDLEEVEGPDKDGKPPAGVRARKRLDQVLKEDAGPEAGDYDPATGDGDGSDDDEAHRCSECGQVFESEHQLHGHLSAHSSDTDDQDTTGDGPFDEVGGSEVYDGTEVLERIRRGEDPTDAEVVEDP